MPLSSKDPSISSLISKERIRQTEGAELIASENYTSDVVMEAQGSILTNKYAEGLPRRRYYGGCEFVDEIEQLAIDRVCELFGAAWANVQPHSGASANAAVMLACLSPGDKILGFDLSHGGHLTHGSPVNFSGKLYNPVFYGVEEETGRVDMDKVEAVAKRENPKMIICGASAYARDWDYPRFREIADSVGAYLLLHFFLEEYRESYLYFVLMLVLTVPNLFSFQYSIFLVANNESRFLTKAVLLVLSVACVLNSLIISFDLQIHWLIIASIVSKFLLLLLYRNKFKKSIK